MKKLNKKPVIGILGGMGPQAEACLLKLIVDISAKEFGAKDCNDFPEIVLDSTPHPDFISDKENKEPTLILLKERVRRLNILKADFLAIAYNL